MVKRKVVFRLSSIVVGAFLVSTLLVGSAAAATVNQCNPPAYPTGAGFEVTCDVTVENNVSAEGATSSRVTTVACLAAAGVLPPAGCTTTVVDNPDELVTDVNQCNGIVNGGGSNVTCRVTVINTVPVGTPAPDVTVSQCIGSGEGGVDPTGPPTLCAPVSNTTNATVTQCNGSANGGGAPLRVQCTVIGVATATPITINQCNDSANGGGSTVTCTTTITNNFITAPPPPPPPPGPPAPPPPPALPPAGMPAIAVLKDASPNSRPAPGGRFSFVVRVINVSNGPVLITSLVDSVYGNLNGMGSCSTGTSVRAGNVYLCQFDVNYRGVSGASETNIVIARAVDTEGKVSIGQDEATIFLTVPVAGVIPAGPVTPLPGAVAAVPTLSAPAPLEPAPASVSAKSPRTLARTGVDTLGLVALASALIALGFLLVSSPPALEAGYRGRLREPGRRQRVTEGNSQWHSPGESVW